MEDFAETYKFIDPTGIFATKKRQELNEKHSLAGTFYPHSWHKSLEYLKGDEKVLCLGIDTSLYAKRLADKLNNDGRIFLVDYNPARMLENRNVFTNDSRFSFCEELLWALPFENNFFDLVICTYTLHRIGKPKDASESSKIEAKEKVDKLLFEIKRLLQKNGTALIATHAKSSFSEILNLYWKVTKELNLIKLTNAEFKHFDGFPQEDAFRILNSIFDKVVFDEIDTSLEFNEISPFMQYWDCFPFPGFGEKDLSTEIRQEIRKKVYEYAQNELAEKGRLKISKPSGVFICQ
jgi:ubiquinone/menaquinone biosynthesis C-methylase UbiE